jgi:C4-dicarboxylate-specific signal transduction histidine kinase
LHVLDFVAPEERQRVRDHLWPLVMREGRWIGELNFRHFRTGASIPFLVDWFRIDDPRTGKPTNIATVSRDLTAQKRAERELRELAETLEQRVVERSSELLELNRQLGLENAGHRRGDARLQELQLELFHAARLSAAGQVAAALAHELNQPLTSAVNFVNAARRGLASGHPKRIDMVRADIDEAVGQVLLAGRIVARLREFATPGKTEKQIESVRTMVEEASSLALTGAAALGVEVHFHFDPGALSAVADRIQIQQVLVNLIRNALEAMTDSRRRELTVTTALVDREAIEIAVADTGRGLAREMMDRLFEPFASTKRHGMGLGLSICRSIVEAHDGKIWAEENPGGRPDLPLHDPRRCPERRRSVRARRACRRR